MFNVNFIYEHNSNHTTSSYFYMNINTNCLSNDIINRYNIKVQVFKALIIRKRKRKMHLRCLSILPVICLEQLTHNNRI